MPACVSSIWLVCRVWLIHLLVLQCLADLDFDKGWHLALESRYLCLPSLSVSFSIFRQFGGLKTDVVCRWVKSWVLLFAQEGICCRSTHFKVHILLVCKIQEQSRLLRRLPLVEVWLSPTCLVAASPLANLTSVFRSQPGKQKPLVKWVSSCTFKWWGPGHKVNSSSSVLKQQATGSYLTLNLSNFIGPQCW
jgi:hypothetical protein